MPFDLCFEAEALGCESTLLENSSLEITKTPFKELNDIDIPEDFVNNARFPVIEKAIELLHEKYDDKNIPLIGSVTGPFTLLSQIYPTNIEGILKLINSNIVCIEEALDNLTNALIEEIDFYNELDVDVITMYEPNATPSLLEPSIFKQLLLPFLEDLSGSMKCPGVLHICGDTTSSLENMLKCGFEGISIASHVDITEAKQLQADLNTHTRICGNISTERTLFMKKPKDVSEETLTALGKGVDILSPSCMIAPNTPLKNIKAMIKARNEFCDMENHN